MAGKRRLEGVPPYSEFAPKLCSDKCSEAELPPQSFSVRPQYWVNKNGVKVRKWHLNGPCKQCMAKRSVRYRKANSEKVNAYQRRWQAAQRAKKNPPVES